MDNMTDRKVETPPDGLNIDGYIFFFSHLENMTAAGKWQECCQI